MRAILKTASLFKLLNALEKNSPLFKELSQKKPALFFDYDGTLTPIVARPDLAILDPKMKALLERLSQKLPVAILSGRGLEDVKKLVGLPQLIYAGSHGMEIAGPHLHKIAEGAEQLRPILEEAKTFLQAQLANYSGVLVEDKKFSLAIHYRLAQESDLAAIEKVVDSSARQFKELKKTTGKKVLELRANISWDKGKALLYLIKVLKLDWQKYLPLYLGDDETDEDAFAVLQTRGVGILVSEVKQTTRAKYYLKDVQAVKKFLETLL